MDRTDWLIRFRRAKTHETLDMMLEGALRLMRCLLLLDVLPDDLYRSATTTRCKVRWRPQHALVVELGGDVWPLFSQHPTGCPF
jgi:hypothetical protein